MKAREGPDRASTDPLADTSLSQIERRTVLRLTRMLQAELGSSLRSVWLFGSRARGEPRRGDSDVDVLVVTDGGRRDFHRVQDVAVAAAEREGYPFVYLAVHVRDPAHVAHKRAIRDFFMQEVDRDRVVLAGER
jgi:predicted nucleotidyltransferase